MTTKEYLSQAYRIDQRINSKLEQINRLHDLATKATSTINEINVCNIGNKQQMESVIVKIVDLENKINYDIDALVEVKKGIITMISKVENPEYQTLLELRYLCFKTWKQIAYDMGYDISWVHRLHNKAIKKLHKPQTVTKSK